MAVAVFIVGRCFLVRVGEGMGYFRSRAGRVVGFRRVVVVRAVGAVRGRWF